MWILCRFGVMPVEDRTVWMQLKLPLSQDPTREILDASLEHSFWVEGGLCIFDPPSPRGDIYSWIARHTASSRLIRSPSGFHIKRGPD